MTKPTEIILQEGQTLKQAVIIGPIAIMCSGNTRITQCQFYGLVMLEMRGENNMVDHCYFAGNSSDGNHPSISIDNL